jgi:hypothetical protein
LVAGAEACGRNYWDLWVESREAARKAVTAPCNKGVWPQVSLVERDGFTEKLSIQGHSSQGDIKRATGERSVDSIF